MSLFEKATRKKYRFEYKGQQQVEDLWDLSLRNLDLIYSNLVSESESSDRHSFLTQSSVNQEVLDKIEIVKHIMTVKLAEKSQREDSAKKAEQKQRILEILQAKEDEELMELSSEELLAKLNS